MLNQFHMNYSTKTLIIFLSYLIPGGIIPILQI